MTTTPGPWTIHWTGRNVTSGHPPDPRKGDEPHVVKWEEGKSGNHYIVQIADFWENENGRDYMLANARLIAAAPEMREHLQYFDYAVGESIDKQDDDDDVIAVHVTVKAIRDARALLARIEGKE